MEDPKTFRKIILYLFKGSSYPKQISKVPKDVGNVAVDVYEVEDCQKAVRAVIEDEVPDGEDNGIFMYEKETILAEAFETMVHMKLTSIGGRKIPTGGSY